MMNRSKSTGRISRQSISAIPTYSSLRTNMLKLTPRDMKCRLYCSGKQCKYCLYVNNDSNAIDGLYSTWITNRIIAMARPTIQHFDKGLIDNLKKLNIKTVINLQEAGEHKYCGPNLISDQFTYDPEDLMKNEIYFYNFPMEDFKTCSYEFLLDVVKVMHFSYDQGNVAVHCHAGHGRTGMLISAFLIYWEGITPLEAVNIVRSKRKDSVQSIDQVTVLNELYSYLKSKSSILPMTTLINGSGQICNFCLESINEEEKKSMISMFKSKETTNIMNDFDRVQYSHVLSFQKPFLAGNERKDYKNVPKIIVVLVKLMLEKLYGWGELIVHGKNINDIKIDWKVGNRIAEFKERDVLIELFQSTKPCELCNYIIEMNNKHLVTVSNCYNLLKNASYSVLIGLLDRNLHNMVHPSNDDLKEIISVDTRLSTNMGAQMDEPWSSAFIIIIRAFSHGDPNDFNLFSKIIYRFFHPAYGNRDDICKGIYDILVKSKETRRFWKDNDIHNEESNGNLDNENVIKETVG